MSPCIGMVYDSIDFRGHFIGKPQDAITVAYFISSIPHHIVSVSVVNS